MLARLVLVAAPCLVAALPTTAPTHRGLPALPSAGVRSHLHRHRLSVFPVPAADDLASLSTAIGTIGTVGTYSGVDLLHGITSTLSTLTVGANPSVNPIEIIEQAERNVGIGFMQQATQDLRGAMDLGSSLKQVNPTLDDAALKESGVVLDSIGADLLVFLAASVIVTPASKLLRITPILGYLLMGAVLGPHGADMFSNSEADLELGDFGSASGPSQRHRSTTNATPLPPPLTPQPPPLLLPPPPPPPPSPLSAVLRGSRGQRRAVAQSGELPAARFGAALAHDRRADRRDSAGRPRVSRRLPAARLRAD
mmetsp:Transcript_3740/g.7924  ORF Transcript_3740/g.7924 Transcript_3740/m.7924 type:complete len:310 (+) Transcript_3740:43-972(+)